MQRNYRLFLLSLFLVNLFLWISIVEFIYGIPQFVKYILSVSVLCIIVYYRFKNPSKPIPGGLFHPIIIAFIIWSILLIISAILKFNSLFDLQRMLAIRYFFIPYLLPVILIYTKFDLEFFSYYFHYSSLLIIPALFIALSVIASGLSPQNWNEPLQRIGIFDIGSTFLLMTAHISKKKRISYIIIFYFLIQFFLVSGFGRRGLLLEIVILFIFMIIMRLRSPFLKMADRMKIYFSGLLLILFSLTFGYILTSSYAFQRGMSKSGFEESRNVVFEGFFSDFGSTNDWVFGRGLNGTVLRSVDSDTLFTEIENGYLLILLKGGLLYLIPFLIVLLRASYLGFFRSSNDLVKALASLLVIHVIMMLYFNIPDYSSKYILIWISVSVCMTPKMRNYSNEEIFQAINQGLK